MSKFGEKIRKIRIGLGMTQEELATRMGYSNKSTITKIEQGSRDVPQNKIAKFAEVLGTTPAILMGWEDEEEEKNNDALANIVFQLRKDLKQNNDALVNIILQLRKDDELLEMTQKLSKLDPDNRQTIKRVLDAVAPTEK